MVDDLLATGGTMGAAARLVQELGAQIVGFAFLIELAYLGGRQRLESLGFSSDRILALVRYDS